jgi:hypothetical protein
VFCVLGLPFTQWGFKTDDWGNIYHSIIKQWTDLLAFFTEGNSETVFLPCNVPPVNQAFFQGLYRPMSFIYYYLQYCLFGTAPYGFLLVSTFFHALNAVLFFNLLSYCVTIPTAFLAATYFGFHPSLGIWVGWTSAQTYFIELFVLFIIIYMLLLYCRTQRLIFYVLGCLLFALNLLLKEQTIFLPFWLIGACYLYQDLQNSAGSWHAKLRRALKLSGGFWLVALGYLFLRLSLFPLTAETGTLTFQPTWNSFITRFSSRFYDAVSYGNELIGLSWLPSGHPWIKGTLLTMIMVIGCVMIWRNTQKKYVLFLLCSIPLFSWPAILMHLQPRYMYMALPLLIASMALLIAPLQKWARILWLILIIWNAGFLVHRMAQREKVLHMITTAFEKLVANPVTHGQSLCFVELPGHWFAQGTAQAVWMLRHDESKPVFQLATTTLTPAIAQERPLIITWDNQHQTFVVVSHEKK